MYTVKHTAIMKGKVLRRYVCGDFAIRTSPFCKNNDINENYTPIYYFEYTNKGFILEG